MALIYAVPSDMATWTGATAPANATQLLRSASILVRRFTETAFYATDAAGLPTDADTLTAFRDATTAQAAFWAAANIDPVSGGFATAGVLRTKKIGSAALEYDTNAQGSVTAFNARRAAATELCSEAVAILQQKGLFTNGPWVIG